MELGSVVHTKVVKQVRFDESAEAMYRAPKGKHFILIAMGLCDKGEDPGADEWLTSVGWSSPDKTEQLQAEIRELRGRLEWKPVETAPRDGAQVIALVNGKIVVCEWMRVLGGGFQWFRHDVGGWRQSKPTHWMPLPAPPEEEK